MIFCSLKTDIIETVIEKKLEKVKEPTRKLT